MAVQRLATSNWQLAIMSCSACSIILSDSLLLLARASHAYSPISPVTGSVALGRHFKFSKRFANHANSLAGLLCGGSREKGDEGARIEGDDTHRHHKDPPLGLYP